MSTTLSRRPRAYAVALVLCGALLVPASAAAATETFHRFEANATANYVVTQDCGDGTSAQMRVTVIGGHEEESESGTTTMDSDFVTVLVEDREHNIWAGTSGGGLNNFYVGKFTAFGSAEGLPGDIVYRRGNATVYFPLVTSIVLSLLLTLLLSLFRR